MKNFKTYQNGLRLVHQYIPSVRSVAFGVTVGTGSVFESEKNNGISHFLEHLMFKGTEKRTAFDIVNEFEGVGAQTNAFTSKNMTCYYFVSIDENAEYCADILSDMFFNSTFPPEEIERERSVILEEISEAQDTPDDVCFEQLTALFFEGHPLAMPIIGSKENVKSFSRDDLVKYKAEKYTSQNTVIAVTGNLSFEDADKLVEKHFATKFGDACSAEGACNDGAKTGKSGRLPAAVPHGGEVKSVKDIEQVHIAFSFPGFASDDKRQMAMLVMNSAFGNGMSSRLFQKIREQHGLAYTVYSFPSFYDNEGSFNIYTCTNQANFEKAKAEIIKEIEILKDGGLTESEVESAKQQVKAAFVFGQESTSSLMRQHTKEAFLRGRAFDIDGKLKEIDAVTKEGILAMVKEIFNFDKMAVSSVSGGQK